MKQTPVLPNNILKLAKQKCNLGMYEYLYGNHDKACDLAIEARDLCDLVVVTLRPGAGKVENIIKIPKKPLK